MPYPSELAVARELSVEASEITNNVPEVLVKQVGGQGIHSTDNY